MQGAGAPLGGVFGNIFVSPPLHLNLYLTYNYQGGILGEYLDWQWVFWVFAILGALITVAGYFVIPLPPLQTEPVSMKAVDWIGGSLITIGILILLFSLTEGNVVGWKTPWVPTLIIVSILTIGAFVAWCWWLEKKGHRRPLMKVSIFKNTRFSAANAIMLLFFASFNNFLIAATYWYVFYYSTTSMIMLISYTGFKTIKAIP